MSLKYRALLFQKSVLCLLCFISVFVAAPIAQAQETSSEKPYKAITVDGCPSGINCDGLPEGTFENWERDKAFLENLSISKTEDCNKIYSILWYWSKKGNLDARFYLLASIATPPDSGSLVLPTVSQDNMALKRYVSTIAVNQIGSKAEKVDAEIIRYVDSLIIDVSGLEPSSQFGLCLKKRRSAKCTEIALENGIVPSFDKFSEEIDTLYAAGYYPFCISGHYFERQPHYSLK